MTIDKQAEELAREIAIEVPVMVITGPPPTWNTECAEAYFKKKFASALRQQLESAAERAIKCLHEQSLAGKWADEPMRKAIVEET